MRQNFFLFSLKIVLTILCVFQATLVHAQEVPADWEFVIMKSKNFDLIVNAKQQELGQIYLQKLEEAYQFLDPLFIDKPERTVVIINDKTDATNGYATPIPYPHIMAYPVLASPQDSLADNGDWPLEFLAHEYTHILTFEPANNFVGVLKKIFGTIVAPNVLLPNWWKEGMAVEVESRIDRGGRLRSPYQDAAIRAMVLDRSFQDNDVAKANEYLPTWPEGMRAYLFGSLIWSEMVADKGPLAMNYLNQRHGGRMPYFINAPPQDYFGINYKQMYFKALNSIERRAHKQIQILKQKPITAAKKLDAKTQYNSLPTVSPNGQYLAMMSVDETDKKEVKIYFRSDLNKTFLEAKSFFSADIQKESPIDAKIQDGPPSGTIQRISWFQNSHKLVYDKLDEVNAIERYSDLHIFDLRTRKTEPLTNALRAREPSVSDDDKKIVFVQLEGGKTKLALLDLESKAVTTVYDPGYHHRISFPIFLSENELLFSQRDTNAKEHLTVLNLQTKQTSVVLADYPQARFPFKNKNTIYFTSTKNGVSNLYRSSTDFKETHPVTHSLTAVFASTFDPIKKDIYSGVMTSQGSAVVLFRNEDTLSTPSTLPKVEPLLADRYPVMERKPAPTVDPSREDYSPWSYLIPRYWIPSLYVSSTTGYVYLEAQTSGFDPLKKHIYNLSAGWDSGLKKGSFQGAYQNNVTSVPLLLQSFQRNYYLFHIENEVQRTNASFSALPSIWKINRYSDFELGYQYSKNEVIKRDAMERSGPYMRLSYFNFSKSGTQISPEEGQSYYLNVIKNTQNTDKIENTQYLFGSNIYFSKFLPARNSISFKLSGLYTSDKISAVDGSYNSAFMPIQDIPIPLFVMRGSQMGQFYGRNLYSMNLEYRLPIWNMNHGFGTAPFFLKRMHGAILADGISGDGFAYNKDQEAFEEMKTPTAFWNYGAEVRTETTVGYLVPINFIGGYYISRDPRFGSSGSIGISLQMGGSF